MEWVQNLKEFAEKVPIVRIEWFKFVRFSIADSKDIKPIFDLDSAFDRVIIRNPSGIIVLDRQKI